MRNAATRKVAERARATVDTKAMVLHAVTSMNAERTTEAVMRTLLATIPWDQERALAM